MKRFIQRAFTLVELLVVIAIIGILSGLIIVGMNNSVQSANIAKAQVFAASLKDSLLGNLVSEWRFDGTGVSDGGTATTAYTQDIWGTNNCTMPGTAPLVYSGTNCLYSSCLKFNGSSDYLDCRNTSTLNLASAITIEAWTKTSVNSGTQMVASRGNDWRLFKSSNTYYFEVRNTSDVLVTPLAVNASNDWLHLVGTYAANGNVKLYINGVLQQSLSQTGLMRFQNVATLLAVSYAWHSGGTYNDYFFNGYIDNVRIYNATIPTSLIKSDYYLGLNRLLAKKELSPSEYGKKIAYNE